MTQLVEAPAPVRTVAIAGADAPLGRRLSRIVAEDPTVVPRAVPHHGDPGPSLVDADVLVVLDPDSDNDLGGPGGSPSYVRRVEELLEAADRVGLGAVVVLSSALAYGAWPNNPVPLTEEAPLRPVPSCATAIQRAEVERLVQVWRAAGPGRSAATLRPVVTVDAELVEWFRASAWAPSRIGSGEGEPPRQFLDLGDLASAVAFVARARLDGAYNVAPDGWLSADELRELAGRPGLGRPGFGRPGLRGAGAEVVAYLEHPWVVANDKLRAAGWAPTQSSETAFVEVDRAGPLRSLGPRVRQELSLAALGVVVLGALAGGIWVLRRRARRR